MKTGAGGGERSHDEWQVDMLRSQHSWRWQAGWGWGSRPARWQAGVRRGRAPVPCRSAACSMHQVLPDLTSQVAAGPSADPAAVAVAEGTAGAPGPGAPAAAADEPPDAHQQTAQHEQGAQHCAYDHAHAPGVCGEKARVRRRLTGRCQCRSSAGRRAGIPGGLRALGHPARKLPLKCVFLSGASRPPPGRALHTDGHGQAEPVGSKHSPALRVPGPPLHPPETFTSTTHTL